MTKSNFWLLVKTNLRGAFDIRRYKKKKAALTSFITFFVLMGFLYLFLSTIVNFTMFMQVKETGGNYNDAVIIACGYCAMITFSTSIFRAKGIFNGNDYEMLKALPIKNRSIIASKIFSMYIVEVVYSLVILLPNMIFAVSFTGNSIYILYGILIILFVPCFPIMLATLISSILTLLIDGSRFTSIINVLAYLVLMLVCILFSMLQSSNHLASVAGLFRYVNPSLIFFDMALNGKYLYLSFFILINILITVFTIIFIARIYDLGHRIADINTKTKRQIKYKKKKGLKALMSIEYKKIFSSKLYLLNSISGGIASIAVIASMFFTLGSLEGDMSVLKDYTYMFSLLPMFFSSIAVPSTSTFSYEGKKIWLLKALPVDAKKVFKAKILVSISLSCVANIIGMVLLGICLKASWFDWLVIVFLNVSYLILCNIIGLAVNSKFYRFDWTEEREIFKNSASVLISTLVGFLIEIAVALSLILLGILNKWLGFITTTALILIPAYFVYYYLIKNSANILTKME